jgi:hypothetical protein
LSLFYLLLGKWNIFLTLTNKTSKPIQTDLIQQKIDVRDFSAQQCTYLCLINQRYKETTWTVNCQCEVNNRKLLQLYHLKVKISTANSNSRFWSRCIKWGWFCANWRKLKRSKVKRYEWMFWENKGPENKGPSQGLIWKWRTQKRRVL